MARKNNPKTDHADLKVRVGIIEERYKGERNAEGWSPCDIYTDPKESFLAWCCANQSVVHTDRLHRYRLATLTFDDDGRKCVIY